MAKLDKTRPYGTLFVGSRKFYSQDGKRFDMGSLDEVEVDTKQPTNVACKLCGANCADLLALESHLKKAHQIDVPAKSLEEKKEQPATENIPVSPPARRKQKRG